ncbi:hypothetical protein R3P38DRAFT_3368124 [Favolaschia claudopus]|uniref:Uncharacterized protein n=1 Tax=Favolaschia claudopus TaxID=2862362 RepID=A0AAW0A7C1_9AGAR
MYRRPASGTLAAPRKRRYHLDTTYGGPASGTFSAVGVVSAVTAPRSGAIALTRRIAVRRARILDFQIYVTPFPAVSPLPRIRASYSQLNVWSSAERRLRAVHKFNFFSTARPSSPPPPTPSLKMKIRFLRVRRATLPAPLPKFFFPLRGPFSSSTPTPCFGNLKIRVPASDVSSSMVLRPPIQNFIFLRPPNDISRIFTESNFFPLRGRQRHQPNPKSKFHFLSVRRATFRVRFYLHPAHSLTNSSPPEFRHHALKSKFEISLSRERGVSSVDFSTVNKVKFTKSTKAKNFSFAARLTEINFFLRCAASSTASTFKPTVSIQVLIYSAGLNFKAKTECAASNSRGLVILNDPRLPISVDPEP